MYGLTHLLIFKSMETMLRLLNWKYLCLSNRCAWFFCFCHIGFFIVLHFSGSSVGGLAGNVWSCEQTVKQLPTKATKCPNVFANVSKTQNLSKFAVSISLNFNLFLFYRKLCWSAFGWLYSKFWTEEWFQLLLVLSLTSCWHGNAFSPFILSVVCNSNVSTI